MNANWHFQFNGGRGGYSAWRQEAPSPLHGRRPAPPSPQKMGARPSIVFSSMNFKRGTMSVYSTGELKNSTLGTLMIVE